MAYKVKFTEKCLEDIEEICAYISEKTKNVSTSKKLRTQIKKKTENLIKTPEMYAQIDKMDMLKRTYRKIVIKNYILLYTIDEIEKAVYVSHMYYSKKDYLKYLV